MTKNKISYEDIINIIDNHMESKTNLMFVCDEDLAEFIEFYMADEYDLKDYEYTYSEDVKEFYVTIYFNKYNANLFIENARGLSGNYKLDESDVCDYFIGTDMTEDECDEYLNCECGTWSWFEIEDDECDEVCDCECCCKCCNEEETITDVINRYTFEIVEVSPCPCCINEKLVKFADEIIGKFN